MALISHLDKDERPREKALARGVEELSDSELLAILFGTGIRGMSAVELSDMIISDNGGHLSHLAAMTPQEMTRRYKGVGTAKAVTIAAALQLGMRVQIDAARQKLQIRSSQDIDNFMRPRLAGLPHEEFWVLHLSRSNSVVHEQRVSAGGIAGTVVDLRLIFAKALQLLASSIVLVHNHPSGAVVPSVQDEQLTRRICQGAQTLDIRVLDHIIVGADRYYSFADNGKMQ